MNRLMWRTIEEIEMLKHLCDCVSGMQDSVMSTTYLESVDRALGDLLTEGLRVLDMEELEELK